MGGCPLEGNPRPRASTDSYRLNSKDRLVQVTFAEHLEKVCAGDNVCFPSAGDLQTLHATKKPAKEQDKNLSRCRYRIEESKG
jgi:hypothetical protein